MVNQTTEILLGISQQTGMQFNELLNMMAQYYVFKNTLNLIFLLIFLIIMSVSMYLIIKKVKKEYGGVKLFDDCERMIYVFIGGTIIFISSLFILAFIESAIIGIMYPKEQMIQNIIENMLNGGI